MLISSTGYGPRCVPSCMAHRAVHLKQHHIEHHPELHQHHPCIYPYMLFSTVFPYQRMTSFGVWKKSLSDLRFSVFALVAAMRIVESFQSFYDVFCWWLLAQTQFCRYINDLRQLAVDVILNLRV